MMSEAPRIEVVGVAGSGKSTLVRTLCTPQFGWRAADTLHTRDPAHWLYVVRATPAVTPLVWSGVRSRPMLSWDEVKFAVYVAQWNRYIDAHHAGAQPGTILDQGPVFALARLCWAQKPFAYSPAFSRFIDASLRQWAETLDAIVVLDARDDVLIERINTRAQPHQVKGAPPAIASRVIGAHRAAYARILERVVTLDMLRIVRFSTDSASASTIAVELASSFQASQTEPGERPRLAVVR